MITHKELVKSKGFKKLTAEERQYLSDWLEKLLTDYANFLATCKASGVTIKGGD